MSFPKRLSLAIKQLGLTKNSFAVRLGYENNGIIYDYTKEIDPPPKPGFDFFERLIHAKTGISLEWLITGEGDMFTEKGTAATNNDVVTIPREALTELREQLKFLRLQNTDLTKAVLQGKVVEQAK